MAYRKRNFRLYDAEHLTEALKEAGLIATSGTVAEAEIDEDGYFCYHDGEKRICISPVKITDAILGTEASTADEAVDGPDGEHLLAMWAL